MPIFKISFIGYGEVASVLSEAILRDNNVQVAAYDVLLHQQDGREILLGRAPGKVRFGNLAETIEGSTCVISTVTTQAAKQAAEECAVFLKPGMVYVDLNSTSPAAKIEIGKIVASVGADFIEGAVLGAIGVTGSATKILFCGEEASEVAKIFVDLGLNVSVLGTEIGKASLFKMLRSIFAKGLEALLLEFLISGEKVGLEKELWEEATSLMTKTPFDRVAANWIQTHVIAHDRRYHEMVQVVETMREIGVEPVMSAGTEAFFKRSNTLGLSKAFPVMPNSKEEVIDYMAERLSGKGAFIQPTHATQGGKTHDEES